MVADDCHAAYNTLTPRQRSVTGYLIAGLDNRRIARKLDVSVRTVEGDRRSVYIAFGVETPVRLGFLLGRAGFRDEPDSLKTST